MNEIKKNYTVTENPAYKVTVTISRKQLWENYIKCWSEMAWQEYHGVSTLQEVADVLLCGCDLDKIAKQVRKLFRNGNTIFLLNEAMTEFDVPAGRPILREIIVQDISEGPQDEGDVLSFIVIPHDDIVF